MEEKIKILGEKTRADHKKAFKKTIFRMAIILVVLVGLILFLRGDFKFAFRKTETTIGAVVETKIYNEGRFYSQVVRYEYVVNSTVYSGKETFILGPKKIGDRMYIEYATGDPSIHEVDW